MTQAEIDIADILGRHESRRSELIPVLQEVQEKFYYLPQNILKRISHELDVPLPDVYHVATFYNCFSLEPVGKHVMQVCLGTACHVRGAPRVLDRILQELKLSGPGTTKDCEFTVRTVRCVGCCGLAPVVRVDHSTHPAMTQAKVRCMLNKHRPKAAAQAEEVPETEDVKA